MCACLCFGNAGGGGRRWGDQRGGVPDRGTAAAGLGAGDFPLLRAAAGGRRARARARARTCSTSERGTKRSTSDSACKRRRHITSSYTGCPLYHRKGGVAHWAAGGMWNEVAPHGAGISETARVTRRVLRDALRVEERLDLGELEELRVAAAATPARARAHVLR